MASGVVKVGMPFVLNLHSCTSRRWLSVKDGFYSSLTFSILAVGIAKVTELRTSPSPLGLPLPLVSGLVILNQVHFCTSGGCPQALRCISISNSEFSIAPVTVLT